MHDASTPFSYASLLKSPTTDDHQPTKSMLEPFFMGSLQTMEINEDEFQKSLKENETGVIRRVIYSRGDTM